MDFSGMTAVVTGAASGMGKQTALGFGKAGANVAAIYPTAKIADVTEEFWDRIHSIDLRGVFFCCQEALRIMAAQGSGAIVNVASGAAFRAVEGQVAYSAAKAGPGRNEPCARLRVRPQGRTSQRRGT